MIMSRFHHTSVLVAGFALCCSLVPVAAEAVWVYRPDGTLQCNMGQEQTLAKSKDVLESLGATVEASEKRTLPFIIIALCGAPTGKVNAHQISSQDWEKVKRDFAEWTFDSLTVEVFKYDGTLQCDMGKGISLSEMAKQLTDAGVKVVSQREGRDGFGHIALCGASTGRVNIFEISSSDSSTAKRLGFAVYHGPRRTGPGASTFNAAGDDLIPWPW